MHLEKIDGSWWVVGMPDDEKHPDLPGIGPFSSRWDADDAMESHAKYWTFTPKQISVDSKAKRRSHESRDQS